MSRVGRAEVALMLVSLLASALVVEVFLRRFSPIDSILYEIHPRYLHRLVPGGRRLFFRTAEDGGAARILVTVNRAGFRGSEIGAKQGLRVVVYGDSFVMATLTEQGETFPKRLETKLRAPLRRPVESINAGVVGYGPDQVSLRFEDEITALDPDLAVVAIYAGNDFGDLMRNKIYRLGPNGELIQNHYRLSSRQIADFPDKPWEVPWSMLVRGVQHLVTPADPPGDEAPWRRGERPEDQLKRYLNKSRLEYKFRGSAAKAEVDNLFGDTYNADVAFTPDASSSQYAVRVMEGVMVRIGALAAARGLPVLFLIIPAAQDVCPGPDAAWVEAVAAYPAYRPDGLTSLLSEIARRNHLEYIDLFRPFEAACSRSLYFKRDGHWNSEGQALAADLVASHVVVRGMVR